MPYVERDGNGSVKGLYANAQPGYAEEFLAEDDAEVEAFRDPIIVPAVVTPLQARKALSASGLRQQIEDWVAAQDQETRDGWEFALQIERTHPLILAAAAALELTDSQVDDLFILAATFA